MIVIQLQVITIVQPYHNENKLYIDEMMIMSAYHHSSLESYSASSLTQQFMGRHVTSLTHNALLLQMRLVE